PPHSTSYLHFLLNAPPTSEIYPLSLHDALPISTASGRSLVAMSVPPTSPPPCASRPARSRYQPWNSDARRSTNACTPSNPSSDRSEEHTSELQSRFDLVCRLLLEKKKIKIHETH